MAEVVEHDRLLPRVREVAGEIAAVDERAAQSLLASYRAVEREVMARGFEIETETGVAFREGHDMLAGVEARRAAVVARGTAGTHPRASRRDRRPVGHDPPRGGRALADLPALAADLVTAGYTDFWSSEVDSWDAVSPLAAVADRARHATLGTAIMPVHTLDRPSSPRPRPPWPG